MSCERKYRSGGEMAGIAQCRSNWPASCFSVGGFCIKTKLNKKILKNNTIPFEHSEHHTICINKTISGFCFLFYFIFV